jgi:O-succinylbenzoic acid--CoA ligase
VERRVERFSFELPAPLATARGTWAARREGVRLTLTDTAGRVGVGEASPLPGYSPDTLEACAAELRAAEPRSPAARFAWETAVARLEASARGVSFEDVLGGAQREIVAESALVTSVAEARAALARGVRTLKVKIGVAGAWARELAFLHELRTAVPAHAATLRLDAGGGFPPGEARERLAALAAFAPEFVEEPVSGAALAALRDSPVPLAADESLQDPSLWPALAATCRVLVLKPTTLGLRRCVALGAEAAERGLALVVTHSFDGEVARAAAAALARALPGRVLACGLTLPAAGPPLSIRTAAREAPGRVALIAEGRSFTYADLAERVAAEAPGAPVRVLAPADNRVATVVALHAALESRTPALLVHPRLTERERQVILAAAAPHPPAPGTAAILFTSGTTGTPRGAMLSYDALVASAAASAVNLGWRADDRWLACMPLAHVGGLSILTRCLAARACVVLEPRFDAPTLPELLVRHRVTLLSLVPTMLTRLLDEHPHWTPPLHLRAVLLGGAGSPARLLARAAERGLPVLTTYGLTEACSQVVTGGRALLGAELRVAGDEGRLQIRGPMLMSGYLGEPPLAPGAWFDTGDLGEIDANGVLRVHARRTDLIVTGGENVYPAEVEDALATCPGIAAACVFGVADETWGQIVAALVVAGPGVTPARATLRAAVAERLAPHKRPRRIAFVDALPQTGAGKLDRAAAARTAPGVLEPL